ncbi:unnamed protein product [Absidia cylindrospora]
MLLKNTSIFSSIDAMLKTRWFSSNPVYLKFHYTLIRQLNQQTFLEMILKSKASKNEDRFYSILPLSDYKNEVDQWNISTMASVKLKLFEFMTTKDKLNLLFMSGSNTAFNIGMVAPTFASSTISTETPTDYLTREDINYPCNFDLYNDSTIMLHQYQPNATNDNMTKSDTHLYYLYLKPIEYLMAVNSIDWFTLNDIFDVKLLNRLGIDDTNVAAIDVVCIPSYGANTMNIIRDDVPYLKNSIILIGNLVKNIWLLDGWTSYSDPVTSDDWTHHFYGDGPGFNIY